MVGLEHAPFPPPRPWARAHPAGARAGPRAGGRSPDEVLQALLAGVAPEDRAGHGGGAAAGRVPLPPPPQRSRSRRTRPALRAPRPPRRLQEVLQLVSFCFCSPPLLHTPGLSPPPLYLLLPLCLVEVSRENLWGRSTKPGAPAPLPGGFSPAFNSALPPSSSPAPSSPPPFFFFFSSSVFSHLYHCFSDYTKHLGSRHPGWQLALDGL